MFSDSLHHSTYKAFAAALLTLFLSSGTRITQAEESQVKSGMSGMPATESRPALTPTLPASALERNADVLMAAHQYVAAIHLYEAIPSPSAPLLNKLGIAYEKMRLYDQAKLTYEKSLLMNPKFSGPENNLGTVYYVQGNYRKAEKHYKRAVKADPRNASIYNNLGTLYFTRRKIHKGVEAYQQALSLDPEIFQRNALNSIQTEGTRQSRALINFYLAETCAQAGMNSAAMIYLQRAVDSGFHDQAKLREDGRFAVLRETPEFKRLLGSMGHSEQAAVEVAP